MTQVDFEDQSPEPPLGKPPGHGRLIAAGVVGALALGAGMGLWARPASPPLPGARPPAPEVTPRPALQIVVDDGPAPIGPLLEVLPGDAPAHEAQPLPPVAAEPVAPRRPAAGLMKVDAVVAAAPLLVPAVKVEPRPEPVVQPKPVKVEAPKAAEKPLQKAVRKVVEAPKAKPEARPDPKAERLKVAEAKAKKAERAKAEKDARLAKAEKAKAGKLAKAEKAKAVKLAKAEPRKVEKAKAEKPKAEPKRLATLVKAVKAAPAKLKAEVAKKKVELAQAKPKPKVQKASNRPTVTKAPAPKPVAPRRPVPVGEGPMRVARNDLCASGDPGEAAVCADRRLGARDRQMQQAYRNAEAAGVPASALRRQQARWLQARAAAAREAPWAVEDVYEARISELNDLTRDAREN